MYVYIYIYINSFMYVCLTGLKSGMKVAAMEDSDGQLHDVRAYLLCPEPSEYTEMVISQNKGTPI